MGRKREGKCANVQTEREIRAVKVHLRLSPRLASGSCCSTMPQKRLPVGITSSSRLVTLNFISMGYNAGVSGEIKEQVRHTRKGLEAILEPFFLHVFVLLCRFFFFVLIFPEKSLLSSGQ